MTDALTQELPTLQELSPKDSPYVFSREEAERYFGIDWNDLEKGKPQPSMKSLENRHFKYEIEGQNQLVLSHDQSSANPKEVLDAYLQLLKSGKIDTSHVKRPADFRPYQRGLRDACLYIYERHCAMCDVDIRPALTASHIRPARLDVDNRTNLQNVLLLCNLHDSLFDKLLLTVKPDYTIVCSPNLESKSKLIDEWVFGIEGNTISRPKDFSPDRLLLKWHSEKSGVMV